MPPAASIQVLHVLYCLRTGGMERVIATVIEHLPARYSHTVLCLSTPEKNRVELPPGTRIEVLEKPEGNSIRFLWDLIRRLKKSRPDLMCTYNWNGMDGILAGRLAGVRRIVQCEHGWSSMDPDGSSRRRQRWRRFLSRWTSAQICVSKGLQDWLEGVVRVRSKVHQICNGVDSDRFRPGQVSPALREELALVRDEFVVGVIARMDPIKNVELSLSAFAALLAENPTARLLVIGTGTLRPRLEAIAGGRVEFLGVREDVPDLLRAIDVLVVPSHNEGISLTILEAMASETPVVACRVGGNPDLIVDGETGVLVGDGDPAAMAAALGSYGRSAGLRAEHGAAGRRRVVSRFSQQAMIAGYAEVYEYALTR